MPFFCHGTHDKFPDRVDETLQHTAYDCLYCQKICSMNADQIDNIENNISFDAEETNNILKGTEYSSLKEETRKKLHYLGMDEWYKVIPRNLKILLSR